MLILKIIKIRILILNLRRISNTKLTFALNHSKNYEWIRMNVNPKPNPNPYREPNLQLKA